MAVQRLDWVLPVQEFIGALNWDNRPSVLSLKIPSEIPFNLLMRDWSVEHFFSAFSWSGKPHPQLSLTGAVEVEVQEEDLFTLNDFSGLFE